MKKFLASSLILGSMAFAIPSVEAATKTAEVTSQQTRYQQNDRYTRRGVRIVTRTRIVRQGFRTYRETIQIKYLPNGRTQTKVISRFRIR